MDQYGMNDDDVVISGVAMAFPGTPSFHDFSSKLVSSIPFRAPIKLKLPAGYIGELPAHSRLQEGKQFMDTSFFGVTKTIGNGISYQSRKVFERTFEALLDAGLNVADCHDIIVDLQINNLVADGEISNIVKTSSKQTYSITGRSRAMEANRISFFLGATGNSASRDAGYLGGLNSFELALSEIRSGRADMCIVCSGSTTVDFKTELQFTDLGWLSKDGQVRAFDNDATGFFRTEGSAAFILQRANNAHRIYAKVKHVSVKSVVVDHLLMKQSPKNWEQMLKTFYAESKIPMERIGYLEAYGCGIKDMDAAEINAVANVICANRDKLLHVGSVKSNMGHAECAADFASVLKALVCLETGFIPANANYSSPNQKVEAFFNGKIKVVDEKTPLPENSLVAISGWSFGSMYGHMILEGFNKPKVPVVLPIPRLVPLSARTSDLLLRTIHTVESIPYDPDYYALVTDVFRRRIDKYLGRGYVLLPKAEKSISSCQVDDERKRPLWFVCSGMGSQWVSMGQGLMKLPISRESLERSHRVLEPHGIDLLNIILSSDPTVFDDILHCFVGIAAIQIALIDVLRALKLTPDGIIGHSVGELACAYADGSVTAEQMILASYYRGKSSQEATLIKGFMAAIGQGYNEIKDSLPDGVEVACHNSSTSCTISGPAETVEKFVDQLKADGVFARTVNVANIAYHSHYIKPAAPILMKYLLQVLPNPKLRSEKWISTSVPEERWHEDCARYCSAEYHTNNLLGYVLFEEGCRHIPDDAVLVEIAPHGLLQAILRRSMGKNAVNIPLTSRDAKDPLVFLLEAIGKIYTAGFNLDVNALYPKVEYPVPRGTSQVQQLVHWVEESESRWMMFDPMHIINIRSILNSCDSTKLGYQIGGNKIYPLSIFIKSLEWLITQYDSQAENVSCTVITDFRVPNPTELSTEFDDVVEESLSRGRNVFEIISSRGAIVAGGVVQWSKVDDKPPEVVSLTAEGQNVLIHVEKDEIYGCFQQAGYVFPPDFQSLQSISITERGVIASISNSVSSHARMEGVLQMLMFDAFNREQNLIFPSLIRKLIIFNLKKPSKGGVFEVVYDRVLSTVYSQEFCLTGVEFREMPSANSLTFREIKTVSYDNPDLVSRQEFLRFCCNIIERTKKVDQEVKILELVDQFPVLQSEILSIIPSADVVVQKLKEAKTISGEYDLVVCNSREFEQVASNTKGFILVQGHCPITIPADFVQVSKYSCEKTNQYWLLKKKIVLNGERNFILMPETKEELLAELHNRRGKSSALIVGFKEPAEGIAQYQEIIESQVDIQLKWVFILDENSPKFNVSLDCYQEQLKQGLSMNVLENGKWHHVYKSKLPVGVQTTGVQFGLVLNDGIERKHVMGILTSDTSPDLDPELSWPLPTSWNEENAKFVPYAYSMAYYCFVLVANVREHDRVLVTDAMSAAGQAAVAVALTLAGRVCASVTSTDEAAQLKKLFPKITEEDIVLHTDKHMSIKLRLADDETNPNVVYNLLDGSVLRNCYANIAEFGNIFHFDQEDIKKNTTIQMGVMIRDVSLFVISCSSIKDWPIKDKKTVQKLVLEGIENGVVRPPDLLSASKLSSKSNKIQQLASKFIISSSGIFVVVGENSDHELDNAEWLARRGAKTIYIYNPSLEGRAHYQHKVQSLKLRRNVNVEIFDLQELKRAIKGKTLEAIFFLNLGEKPASYDRSLFDDIVGTKTQHFVVISKSQELALKMHQTAGIHTAFTNIILNVDNNLICQVLDLMAPFIGKHSTISVNDEVALKAKKLAGRLLEDFFPKDIDAYARLGSSLKRLPEFVEITTSCERWNDRTEVSPVFVIPGLEDDPVEFFTPLLQNLLYPAFVANIPDSGFVPISVVASALIPMIKKIYSGNAYNLVGLSAGVPIAIELARQLELQGATVAVLIVDNPLKPLHYSTCSIEDMQSRLLGALSALSPKPLDGTLQSLLPWPMLLDQLVSRMDLPPETETWVRQAACYIHDRFSAISDYSSRAFQIKGPLTILRSRDHHEDYNYNTLSSMHITVDVPLRRKALLQSDELRTLIHKNAISDDMVITRMHWPEFDDLIAMQNTLGD